MHIWHFEEGTKSTKVTPLSKASFVPKPILEKGGKSEVPFLPVLSCESDLQPADASVLPGLLTLGSSSQFSGARGKGDEWADVKMKGGKKRMAVPVCP